MVFCGVVNVHIFGAVYGYCLQYVLNVQNTRGIDKNDQSVTYHRYNYNDIK